MAVRRGRSDSGTRGKSLGRHNPSPDLPQLTSAFAPSNSPLQERGTQVCQMFTQSCTGDHTPMLSTDAGSMFSIYCMHHDNDRILSSKQRPLKHTPWHSPTCIQNVVGRCATKVERALPTRWGSGKRSLGSRSCLMYGRRISSVFSISTTRRIYE
jgi:hypothetical protein